MNITNTCRCVRIPMGKLGRICVPASIRRYLGLTPGSDAELIFTPDGNVLLQPPQEHCALCGTTERLKLVYSADNGPRYLCPACLNLIRE